MDSMQTIILVESLLGLGLIMFVLIRSEIDKAMCRRHGHPNFRQIGEVPGDPEAVFDECTRCGEKVRIDDGS